MQIHNRQVHRCADEGPHPTCTPRSIELPFKPAISCASSSCSVRYLVLPLCSQRSSDEPWLPLRRPWKMRCEPRYALYEHYAFEYDISDANTNASALKKINEAFAPASLEIFNDSHLHAHHKAMEGVTSRETHFRSVAHMLDEVVNG